MCMNAFVRVCVCAYSRLGGQLCGLSINRHTTNTQPTPHPSVISMG